MKNTYKTSDIGIAAYVMMRGLKLISAGRAKNSGRFEFVFEAPNNQGLVLSVEYANSESAKFDAHMKNLKNILYKS